MKHGFRSKMQLSAALLVAGVAGIARPRVALRALCRTVQLWISGFKEDGVVDLATYERRLFTCRQCPVFYRPLQTCGSPLSKRLRGLGCACHMPTKARLKDAWCYLDSIYDDDHYGWNE